MPTHEIQTTEYECSRCSYRWIGRKNGIERKNLPKFCPKCKTWMPYRQQQTEIAKL